MSRFYEVIVEPDMAPDGRMNWLVTAPAFPEVTTFGINQASACQNGLGAIEEAMAARMADGEDIPAPMNGTHGLGRYVHVPGLTYLKIALYKLCRHQKVSRAELGRRLTWHREQVDRLFRLDHKSHLEQMEAAYMAIGVPLSFTIKVPDAA